MLVSDVCGCFLDERWLRVASQPASHGDLSLSAKLLSVGGLKAPVSGKYANVCSAKRSHVLSAG